MEDNLTGRKPHRKTTSQEDNLKEDKLIRRQPHRQKRQIKVNGLASQYGLSLAQLSPSFFPYNMKKSYSYVKDNLCDFKNTVILQFCFNSGCRWAVLLVILLLSHCDLDELRHSWDRPRKLLIWCIFTCWCCYFIYSDISWNIKAVIASHSLTTELSS